MNQIMTEDMDQILQQNIEGVCFKHKTVMVTGATGMLPSYMVFTLAHLNEKMPEYHIQILAVVRNREKAEKLFADYLDKPYFQLLIADFTENFDYQDKVDYIVHAASLASSQYFGTDPAGTFLPNVLGTHGLLKLAQKKQVKGFLFLSSGEVYGQTPSTNVTEETLGMVDPLNIRNSYAEGKRAGEMLCKIWNHQFGVPTMIARISHTYGPMMDLKSDKRVFSEFVNNVVMGEDIVMKSDGTAIRPFCYISDATAAFFKILLDGEGGQAYNVCNHNGYISIVELAELLVSLFPERNLKVVRQQREKTEAYIESFTQSRCTMDNGKLRALGWDPIISLEQGFRRTVQSFVDGK